MEIDIEECRLAGRLAHYVPLPQLVKQCLRGSHGGSTQREMTGVASPVRKRPPLPACSSPWWKHNLHKEELKVASPGSCIRQSILSSSRLQCHRLHRPA